MNRGMRGTEELGGNSPSRKKRLAFDCKDSVRVSRGLGMGLTARQKGRIKGDDPMTSMMRSEE
jgi:hypothetical protein